MAIPIDPNLCAGLVREIADRQRAVGIRPADDESLAQLIGRARHASAIAAAEMRSRLATIYPDIGWIRAEDGESLPLSGRRYWVYDPIDGAYHYLQGLPLWSASLALVSEAKTVFSAIYDPSLGEMFIGSEAVGATLNGVALRPSQKSELKSAVVATALPPFGFGAPEHFERATALLSAVARRTFSVRQMASASLHLAYVAAGRLDAYWEVGRDIEDWLAGAFLVQEAGGAVFDLAGKPFDQNSHGILAAPHRLASPLFAAIADGGATGYIA